MNREKIGYNPGSLITTEQMLKFSKQADAANTHSIWIPESWGREAFSSLGAISQITKNVKLGTAILSIYGRTPSTIAMGATTLDTLSDNRTIIGLGASTPVLVENWHSQKFENPLGRMKEYIECLNLINTGKKVNYQGKLFKINDFKLLYNPIRSKIPIYMAAVNNRMISLGCNIADGLLLYLRPYDELKRIVKEIKSKVDDTFEISCVFICSISSRDPDKARKKASKTLAFYISVGKYYNQFLRNNGFNNEVEDIANEYRANGLDSASKLVSDNMLDSLTLAGSPEQALEALERFKSTGITLPILQFNPIGDIDFSIKEVLNTFNG